MTRVDATPFGRALVAAATLVGVVGATSTAWAQQPPAAAQPLPPATAQPLPPAAQPAQPAGQPLPPATAPTPAAAPTPAPVGPIAPTGPDSAAVGPAPAPNPSMGPGDASTAPPEAAPPKGTGYMNSKVPAYAAFGVAGVGLIVGTVAGVMAMSARDDFEKTPTYNKADRFDNLTVLADLGLGTFAVAGITGAILYLYDSDPAPKPAAGSSAPRTQTGFRLTPMVSPKSQGAALTLRF